MMRTAAAVVLSLGLLAAVPLAAQAPATGTDRVAPSPILTLDEERLFTGSRFGQRVLAELEAESQLLQAENRRIEAQLTEEERVLTAQRQTLQAEAFRRLADDFDDRVQAFRRAQDAKGRVLVNRREEERRRFFNAALPVLGALVAEAGAVAVLSNEAIVLAFGRIDVTDVAIARLDAELGDGLGAGAETLPENGPENGPDDVPNNEANGMPDEDAHDLPNGGPQNGPDGGGAALPGGSVAPADPARPQQ